MGTTIDLDDESEKAIDNLRRGSGLELAEAVNLLIHRGATVQPKDYVFPHVTADMRAVMSVEKTCEVLDRLA